MARQFHAVTLHLEIRIVALLFMKPEQHNPTVTGDLTNVGCDVSVFLFSRGFFFVSVDVIITSSIFCVLSREPIAHPNFQQ